MLSRVTSNIPLLEHWLHLRKIRLPLEEAKARIPPRSQEEVPE